jgi:DNA-binding NtrC family response regulator
MNVLLIDDDLESLECLRNALQLSNCDVNAFQSVETALKQFPAHPVDVVISDYHLPNTTGVDVLKAIHLMNTDTPVIIISGDPQQNIENLSLQAGAVAFFKKPLNVKKLMVTLHNTIQNITV